jgi:hypothetical protein
VRKDGGPARPPGPYRLLPTAYCLLRDWLIRSAGLVSWDDLFDGNGDPRDFDNVVRRKGLTLEQLRRAGVAEGVARRAGGRAGAAGEMTACHSR